MRRPPLIFWFWFVVALGVGNALAEVPAHTPERESFPPEDVYRLKDQESFKEFVCIYGRRNKLLDPSDSQLCTDLERELNGHVIHWIGEYDAKICATATTTVDLTIASGDQPLINIGLSPWPWIVGILLGAALGVGTSLAVLGATR